MIKIEPTDTYREKEEKNAIIKMSELIVLPRFYPRIVTKDSPNAKAECHTLSSTCTHASKSI